MNAARLLQRLGLPGVLALGLLCGAAWLHWKWLPGQRAAVAAAESQVRRLRHDLSDHALRQADPARAEAIDSPEQAWSLLWQGLPSADQRLALQGAVLSTAQDKGLRISAVQYQGSRQPWASRDGEVLWRQRMVLPVEGSYASVRAWLAELLHEQALSIDALLIDRKDPAIDEVQARIALSLWWRKADARPAGAGGGRP